MITKGNSMDSDNKTMTTTSASVSAPASAPSSPPPPSQVVSLVSGPAAPNGAPGMSSNSAVPSASNLLRRAETIECIVVRDDGQRMPADIDLCNNFANSRRKTLNSIVAQVELQAEAKRNELRALILEHQKLVNDIQRLELFKQHGEVSV